MTQIDGPVVSRDSRHLSTSVAHVSPEALMEPRLCDLKYQKEWREGDEGKKNGKEEESAQ